MMPTTPRSTGFFRWLTLASYFVLLALLLNWLTWLAPPQHLPVALALMITTLPLLVPLRGLLHGRAYTHAWSSFLALPYFALAVAAIASGPTARAAGWVLLVSSVGWFLGSVGYARCHGRALRRDGTPDQGSSD